MRLTGYLFFVTSAVRLEIGAEPLNKKPNTEAAYQIEFNNTTEEKSEINATLWTELSGHNLDADKNTNGTHIVEVVEKEINDTYSEKENNEPLKTVAKIQHLFSSLSQGGKADPYLKNYFEDIIFEPKSIAGLSVLPIPPPPPVNHDSTIIRHFRSVSSIYR